MTGLPLLPGLVLVIALAIATLVGARVLARRAAGPLEVRVVGEVPPVSDWLPDAVKKFAAQSVGSSVHFTDQMDGPILRGHLARVTLPTADVRFDVRTQPHLVLQERPRSHPLVVIIDTIESPRRAGLSKLAYGPTPTTAVLELRSHLQRAIARAARDRGLTVQAPRPSAGRAAMLAGSVLIVVVLLATALGALTRWQAGVAAEPSPTLWFPAGATECPGPSKAPGKAPTRAAVAKGTSCAFAERVRAAYAKSSVSGPTVKLGKLRYDKATKLSVTCTSGQPVVCKAGSEGAGGKIVYLS